MYQRRPQYCIVLLTMFSERFRKTSRQRRQRKIDPTGSGGNPWEPVGTFGTPQGPTGQHGTQQTELSWSPCFSSGHPAVHCIFMAKKVCVPICRFQPKFRFRGPKNENKGKWSGTPRQDALSRPTRQIQTSFVFGIPDPHPKGKT